MTEAQARPTDGGAAAACWCYWNAEYQRGHVTWARDEDQQKFLEGMAKGE